MFHVKHLELSGVEQPELRERLLGIFSIFLETSLQTLDQRRQRGEDGGALEIIFWNLH